MLDLPHIIQSMLNNLAHTADHAIAEPQLLEQAKALVLYQLVQHQAKLRQLDPTYIEAPPLVSQQQLHGIAPLAGLEQLGLISPRTLGEWYEQLSGLQLRWQQKTVQVSYGRQRRRQTGTFYTPRQLIEEVLISTVLPTINQQYTHQTSEPPRLQLLDPAAGTGFFLLEALDLLSHYLASYWPARSNQEWRREVAQHWLFGVENQPLAAWLTRQCLWLSLAEPNISATAFSTQVLRADSLDIDQPTWARYFPTVFQGPNPGFDCVIGNPPWMSFSGRKSQPLTAEQRHWYAQHYRSFAGWPATHTMFGERALQLVRHGGRVGLIVPDQVGYLATYRSFREVCAQAGFALEYLHYLGETEFRGVISPALIYVGQLHPPNRGSITLVGRDGTTQPLEVQQISADPAQRWWAAPPVISANIASRCEPLGTVVRDYGVHTGNAATRLLAEQALPGSVPLLVGADVQRYRVATPRLWLRIDQAKTAGDYWQIGPAERFYQTAIVIRQTADRPIAAFHNGQFFRNSLLGCAPKPPYANGYLLAIINSQLMARWYASITPEAQQQAFPQVKIGNLRQMPIRQIIWSSNQQTRQQARQQTAALIRQQQHPQLLTLVDYWLSQEPEQSDLVHDLIADIAEYISDTNDLHHTPTLDHVLDQIIERLYQD